MKNKVGVLGTGAFGSALSNVLLENKNNEIYMYGISEEEAKDITTGYNRKYFANSRFNEGNLIVFINDLLGFSKLNLDYLIIAIPSKTVMPVLEEYLKQAKFKKTIFVNVAKGLEPNKMEFFSKEIKNLLEQYEFDKKNYVQLAGPSFANEVFNKCLTMVNLASKDINVAKKVKKIFECSYFKCICIKDLIGAQVCSIAKNIAAIGAGIVYSLYESSNTRSAYIVKVVKEIKKLIKLFGGSKSTITSLCGIGDIVLTCSDEKSRNFSFGKSLVLSKMPLIEPTNLTVEGYTSAKVIYHFIQKHPNKYPLFTTIYKILYENGDIHNII